jgi:hypothetical protein
VKLYTLEFDAHYDVERLNNRPQGNMYEFRCDRNPLNKGGLILEMDSDQLFFEVTPFDGKSWTGSFESGPGGRTGVFATPSAEVLCVVAKGQGFWIPVLSPTSFEAIRAVPIKEILTVPRRRILIFVDYTKLAAYGEDGFLWQTDRLSWDGLKITEVSADMIRGMAWDSPANQEVPFSVDAQSGASEGGSSPAKYGAAE